MCRHCRFSELGTINTPAMDTNTETPPADFVIKLAHTIRRLESLRDVGDWPSALLNLAYMAKNAPLILSAVASRDVVDMVLAMSDGPACYGILNARIGWLKDRYLQLQYVGKTLSYKTLAVGDVTTFGAVMELCPRCQLPGVKHDYGHVVRFVHVEKIDSWLESTPVEFCLHLYDAADVTAPPSQNE